MPDLQKAVLYGGKVVLWFKPKGHTYYGSKPNGEPDFDNYLISNTAATGILDKPALKFWAVGLAQDYVLDNIQPGKIIKLSQLVEVVEQAGKQHTLRKEEGADVGTQIHDWIENDIKGNKPLMPEDENVLNGVNAWLKWKSEHKVKFLKSETIVYSKKHNFVGRLDIVAIVDGKLTIVDLKTGNMWKKDKAKPDGLKRDKKGNLVRYELHDEWRYQTAGYRLAEEEESKKKFDGDRLILWIDKMFGNLEPFQLDGYDKDREAFLACLLIKRREKELKPSSNFYGNS